MYKSAWVPGTPLLLISIPLTCWSKSTTLLTPLSIIDFESMISTDLYFFEKGISILDSDTMTSSKFTDWEKTERDINKSDIFFKKFRKELFNQLKLLAYYFAFQQLQIQYLKKLCLNHLNLNSEKDHY